MRLFCATLCLCAVAAIATPTLADMLMVTPGTATATVNDSLLSGSAGLSIDSSNLSAPLGTPGTTGPLPTAWPLSADSDYNNDYEGVARSWLSSVQPNGTGAGILFNLNGAYNITGMHVYNYQELYSGQWYNGRSVQTAEIFYSTAPDGSGMIDAGQVTIPEAPDGNSPGGAAYAGSDVQLTAPLMGATFIQLGFETNYGDSQIIGINEVRFEANTAVPEPATLSLLLLGGLAALRRRK